MAVSVERFVYGTLDGMRVERIVMQNSHDVQVAVITLGAALQSVILPDRDGKFADVAPGHATIEGYRDQPNYFGTTVGRFANRIAKGEFAIDGKSYRVPVNNGLNTLHGGAAGFDKRNWDLVDVSSGPTAQTVLRLVSPEGDQGYPGNLTVMATYTLDEDNVLSVAYSATTDAPTIVNITNHAYWNLAGDGSPCGAMGHILTIPAETFLPTDAGLIPTGEVRPVAGTPFDFRTPAAIGQRVRDARDAQIRVGKGYDHNYVLAREVALHERLMARLVDPGSGRGFELWSNQPGLQFYSGNFLDATIIGKTGKLYRQGDAIALEPQLFPDTPNQPDFGSARLDPGQTYHHAMSYRFFVDKASGQPTTCGDLS